MSRVLMTADADGGVWSYALELARGLAAAGLSTTIAAMGPEPGEETKPDAGDVPGLEIVRGDFAPDRLDDQWHDVERSGRWLLDLEARVNPIMIHLNGFAHGGLPWRAPVVIVGHSCVLSRADAVGETFDPQRQDRYRAAIRAGLRTADWIVAPSAAMLAQLRHHYGPLPRASAIWNGRSAAAFPPLDKEPLILTGGRLRDRAKNIEAIAAIAPDLDWPVAALGEDSAGPAIHSLGRLAERDVAGWLGHASIFALPARYEPFGLLPLEAALAGCALVLGDITSLREIWRDAADYVDCDDRTALKLAIEALIDNPHHRAERAALARERALELTPARMTCEYISAYGSAAGRAGSRRSSCVS
jgi:glycosyltransferase involved in cell wall biosynthesis